MADNPQQTLRELKDLVVTYTKQETIDPIKGLGRYIAFGVGGATLMGTGVFFVAIGILRLLQDKSGAGCRLGSQACTHTLLDGNWSWVPYGIVFVLLVAGAGLAWIARGKQKKQAS